MLRAWMPEETEDCIILRDKDGLRGDVYKDALEKVPWKPHVRENLQPVLRQLCTEFDDGTLYRGNWELGEIEIISPPVGINVNPFYVEVCYRALFPPTQPGVTPFEGLYRNLIWRSGVRAGSGALPITTEGELIVVHSFRHAVRGWRYELIRGIRRSGESDVDCALREAVEEVGAERTDKSSIIDLGGDEPDSGILRSLVSIHAVTDIRINEDLRNRDTTESIMNKVVLPVPKFLTMVRDGEIKDSMLKSAFTSAIAHGLIRV